MSTAAPRRLVTVYMYLRVVPSGRGLSVCGFSCGVMVCGVPVPGVSVCLWCYLCVCFCGVRLRRHCHLRPGGFRLFRVFVYLPGVLSRCLLFVFTVGGDSSLFNVVSEVVFSGVHLYLSD